MCHCTQPDLPLLNLTFVQVLETLLLRAAGDWKERCHHGADLPAGNGELPAQRVAGAVGGRQEPLGPAPNTQSRLHSHLHLGLLPGGLCDSVVEPTGMCKVRTVGSDQS